MAGKAIQFSQSAALNRALDKMSKNTAIDMLLDLCHREIGELATDEEIANWFSIALEPVARVRGDKPINFAAEMARQYEASRAYRERNGLPV